MRPGRVQHGLALRQPVPAAVAGRSVPTMAAARVPRLPSSAISLGRASGGAAITARSGAIGRPRPRGRQVLPTDGAPWVTGITGPLEAAGEQVAGQDGADRPVGDQAIEAGRNRASRLRTAIAGSPVEPPPQGGGRGARAQAGMFLVGGRPAAVGVRALPVPDRCCFISGPTLAVIPAKTGILSGRTP